MRLPALKLHRGPMAIPALGALPSRIGIQPTPCFQPAKWSRGLKGVVFKPITLELEVAAHWPLTFKLAAKIAGDFSFQVRGKGLANTLGSPQVSVSPKGVVSRPLSLEWRDNCTSVGRAMAPCMNLPRLPFQPRSRLQITSIRAPSISAERCSVSPRTS